VIAAERVGPAVGWTPPADADPRAILLEAEEDARRGGLETALAKLVWFHGNALRYHEELYGVRLSLALTAWRSLADAHPPALAALRRARDEAHAGFAAEPDPERARRAFHDYEAINRKLGEERETAAAFEALDAARPAVAARVFDIAQTALVAGRRYALYARYVQPGVQWARAALTYRLNRSLQERFGPGHRDFTEKSFTNDVATLVGVLAANGRRADAEAVAEEARLEWDDPGFHAAIDHALAGHVPEPWP
jgi:hypothetical protein